MEMMSQEGIIPQTLLTTKNFLIVGAGSTGSMLTFCLSKLGISNIEVVDDDIVESSNIPNQIYKVSDIGKSKVECLKEIIKDFTGTEITTYNAKFNDGFTYNPGLNNVVILTVDNMEARKLVYERFKDFPIMLIDTRMGGEGYQIQVIDLTNAQSKSDYEKTLEGEFREMPCGTKATSYSIMSLASETTNIVKRILKEEQYSKIVLREMPTYQFIAGK